MSLYLGTPTGGRLHHRHIESVERDLALGVVATWRRSAGPFVSMNRNALLGWFLEGGHDTMVQVDDDVAWQPGALADLLQYLGPAHPVVFADMPDRQMGTSAYVWAPDLAPAPYQPVPYEVDAFGAGMFAVTREFLLRLPPGPFDLVDHCGYQRREDLSFSLLLAKCKVRPLCVPNLGVAHYSAELPVYPRRA